ncbi:DUF5317 family protein [Actinoplanes aureus]|uniref:DUF5317 family protein n=1 Tax=Actinoplanes aureus TaxID=2792083 RepID=A0A931G1Y3_9ACTN|nr:DUF5317 family protein [Actinoplanes aureus]MBG0565636.1 DUF5317 family protein [Actinoplanes aureus]
MAVLMLAPLLLAVPAGYLAGGRLRHLIHVPLRHAWLLWLAAVLQFLQLRHIRPGFSLLIPVFGLAFAFLLANLRGRGRALQLAVGAVLTGGALNAAAIAVNGRMPHTAEAVQAAAALPADPGAAKHFVADAGTRLLWLGDVIPVPAIHGVISIGDIALLLGAAGIIAAGMRPSGVRISPADDESAGNDRCSRHRLKG